MDTDTLVRPGLSALADRIRTAVVPEDPHASSAAVAAILGVTPGSIALLRDTERAGSAEGPLSTVLHAEAGFSVVGLVWRAGQRTTIHDHISWCVVQVLQGTEHETLYRNLGDRLVPAGWERNDTGSITALVPPGDIHRVSNVDDEVAISLHVYGADLRLAGSSVRRIYDAPATAPRLTPETVDFVAEPPGRAIGLNAQRASRTINSMGGAPRGRTCSTEANPKRS